jgi:hypothetical protein
MSPDPRECGSHIKADHSLGRGTGSERDDARVLDQLAIGCDLRPENFSNFV